MHRAAEMQMGNWRIRLCLRDTPLPASSLEGDYYGPVETAPQHRFGCVVIQRPIPQSVRWGVEPEPRIWHGQGRSYPSDYVKHHVIRLTAFRQRATSSRRTWTLFRPKRIDSENAARHDGHADQGKVKRRFSRDTCPLVESWQSRMPWAWRLSSTIQSPVTTMRH